MSAAHAHGSPDDRRLAQLTATARALAGEVSGPLRRVSVQLDGARVELEWEEGARAPVEPVRGVGLTLAPTPAGDDPNADGDTTVAVVSPVVGTFYQAPTPGAPPFVAVGTTVGPDTVVGIVEAMKLMNHITAGRPGVVRAVLVADGGPVEFDQPLVLLEPADDDIPDGAAR